MISLMALWRDNLPWLNLQLRPCAPNWSTSEPQWTHLWGRHRGAPTLRPTAILMVSSLMRRPRDEMGGAWSQAPDSLVLTANNLALDTWSLDAIRESKTTDSLGSSHAFWELASSGVVTGASNFSLQIVTAKSFSGYVNWLMYGGSISRIRLEAPTAEAKKAEGARKEALLMPRPPYRTGRVAWIHA